MDARAAVHPDLVLLREETRRGILCLALEDAQDAQLHALAALGAFHVYRQGRQAALLYAQDSGFAGLDAVEAKLCALGLQAGVSGPFALAASAHGGLHKAQIALETGRRLSPGDVLYPMDAFGEAALLAAAERGMRTQGFVKEDFCDETLADLARTDAAKGTEYTRSLEAYLSCGLDLKRAAQQMDVHRNTLAYRVARIQERFGLDLGDMNTCFELLFSFWLYRNLPDTPPECIHREGVFDARVAQAALWNHVDRGAWPDECAAPSFPCALLCVGVGRLLDDARTALLLHLQEAAPDAAFAYDEDVLLAAVAPHRMPAFEADAVRLCEERSCPMVTTQPFPAARIGQRARLCRMALCAASGAHTRTQAIGSTLFFMAMERVFSLSPYLCEDVIRVMDDDAQKGTALSRSLYAYLLNFRDMKKAAQQLRMHRNTMEYHMRKIGALIGKENGQDRRFMMMCTYKMLALPEVGRYGL